MATKIAGITKETERRREDTEILTAGALVFLQQLERKFGERRNELLQDRQERQKRFDSGELPDFLPETKHIREGDWTIAPIPDEIKDRRVEITGPVDRKMVINALNSGAKVFMACFEDATSPTWDNLIHGQINLKDVARRSIEFTNDRGKKYELNENPAVLFVRPRGWHLDEKHLVVDGKPMSASLFDFGLYFYHNAEKLIESGTRPYFYLPKLESHLEARLWNDVFIFAQKYFGIPKGTIKATVLIETITAAFEMDEILHELRDHSAGLNCGRWDYIFSYLKKRQSHADVVLPNRSIVTMTVPFMRAYSLLTIQTCHKRNAQAIGGMAAQIPVKGDDEANRDAFNKVKNDKEREAKDGHDGTWVAHPGLVPVAMEVFNQEMPTANQIHLQKLKDIEVSAEELLEVPEGNITEVGLRQNIRVGILYIANWLQGRGAVPINNLMEDAATAEISRAQIWQWIRHPQGQLEDGRDITISLYEQFKKEELDNLISEIGEEVLEQGRYYEAVELFDELILQDEFIDFLTLPGYEIL
ncbi:malate synthase A [Salinibacillus xinjiangensis]|uniref:Malate synthase n=1 Tax=Salinibacillus xinjiangensis TaxID=1229268 RepID=A0A6G1X961_9BACI|nr:malate synthase A [Salinibacillus xinjiangensis]MRG87410.1 malate synthase A [Salinibacillus xinjiangensis]